jgi:DNA-directed RNA polymerase sigma subunit (sigma70/sigma32)
LSATVAWEEVLVDDREQFEQVFGQALAAAAITDYGQDRPLLMYLKEISGVRRLALDEEAELAAKALRDPAAKQLLTEANLFVAAALAWLEAESWLRTGRDMTAVGNLLDLIQWGNVGLCRAVESFDPESARSFNEYAQSKILEAIRGGPDDGPQGAGRPAPLPPRPPSLEAATAKAVADQVNDDA